MQQIQFRAQRFPRGNPAFFAQMFRAKSAQKGGVVRRAVRDVEREVGRAAFVAEIEKRGYHLLECGGQFIVVCSSDHLTVHR